MCKLNNKGHRMALTKKKKRDSSSLHVSSQVTVARHLLARKNDEQVCPFLKDQVRNLQFFFFFSKLFFSILSSLDPLTLQNNYINSCPHAKVRYCFITSRTKNRSHIVVIWFTFFERHHFAFHNETKISWHIPSWLHTQNAAVEM